MVNDRQFSANTDKCPCSFVYACLYLSICFLKFVILRSAGFCPTVHAISFDSIYFFKFKPYLIDTTGRITRFRSPGHLTGSSVTSLLLCCIFSWNLANSSRKVATISFYYYSSLKHISQLLDVVYISGSGLDMRISLNLVRSCPFKAEACYT